MTGKDPKDMTASELMRYLHDRNSSCSCFMCNKVLNIVGCGEHVCADAYEALADKIDAELAEARKDAIRESKKPMWWLRSAIEHGEDWPEPRDGEKFRDYLHRCFLPRPRFEDGEVVGVREYEDIQGYCVYDDGEFFVTTPNRSIDYAAGERVERPAPEALGADGKPIVEGETVWLDEAHSRCAGSCGFEDGNEYSLCGIERQEMLTVEDAHIEVDGREYVRVCTCGAWCHASWLTHTPPETQERIDDDATLSPREYYNAHIGHDVGLKDDEEVAVAMVHDLLRRQRELDKRTGGAE